jgi:hypothetical protein
VNPRLVAVLGALFLAVRVAHARVALLPGVAVPVVVPFGVGLVAVVVLAVWLIARRARRFRSCPHPHPVPSW